ncbi:DUF6843 domain-containing protein [Paenibacillus allorhizosphaerae]|uniref:DUF6843 domain-containing protein n=1 Tax=Paenibacillus allorhizosphaerae TaxID=2849866 RepID=A0ABM8VUX3_9BACL|nr:hypothetical protein [Paenibacillus allorhizosphaerae]CAG7659137.1 hypothetical protein PAECIP111802_07402 [Paenibacillus allorhizosphaerae]
MSFPKKLIFLLPDNFLGVFEVRFEQKEYPSLKRDGFFSKNYVYEIPTSGVLNTSSNFKEGTAEFYYVDLTGNRKKVDRELVHPGKNVTWDEHYANGTTEHHPPVMEVFIGSEDRWREFQNSQKTK